MSIESLEKTCRVLDEVAYERGRQDARWGEQNHSPALWNLTLGEEVGEVAAELTKSEVPPVEDDDRLRRLTWARMELVQVAAVAVAFIESLDRNELKGIELEGIPQ